jgi:hypothetical protein
MLNDSSAATTPPPEFRAPARSPPAPKPVQPGPLVPDGVRGSIRLADWRVSSGRDTRSRADPGTGRRDRRRPVVVHCGSLREGGSDACCRAKARARMFRLTSLDWHTFTEPPLRHTHARLGSDPLFSATRVPLRVRLPGSQCGVGNGRTIAWTAHDDEFSSRDRSLAVAEQPAEGTRARCQAQW